uniref:Ycf1 n=1 Tax=Begonia henrilaportei TaxID=1977212 RepID=UPI0022FD4C29|nr:Ycf1 [Begonia henrilaportei]WBN95965.1 Ycf1 [Begonia henrilaportei]
MIFQSFILGNLVSLCMKIINSVVVVGLYYGFLTTFSIGPSYLFLLRARVMEEGTEKKVSATTGFITGQLMMFISIYYAPLHLALGRPHTITVLALPYLLFHFFWNNHKHFFDYGSTTRNSMRNLSIQCVFLNNLIFQLLNHFILPSSMLFRLVNISMFRCNNKMLFVTSSFVGWLIGHILFMKWVGLVLVWIQQNNSIRSNVLIRSNKYLVSEFRNSMARIFSILLFITCVSYLGRIPSPILTNKLKETEERGESEEETDVEIETTSETKVTKQEKEGSTEEDTSPSLFSEEKEDPDKIDETEEIRVNGKEKTKDELHFKRTRYKKRPVYETSYPPDGNQENSKFEIDKKEKINLFWFEKPLVTILFDYKRWNRPLRYIKNDQLENAVRNEMSQYFFYTCKSDGKERISFTYPPNVSIFMEMIQRKISLFTIQKLSSDQLYNHYHLSSINEHKRNNLNKKLINRVKILDKGALVKDILEKRIRFCNDKTNKKYLPKTYDPFLNRYYRGKIKIIFSLSMINGTLIKNDRAKILINEIHNIILKNNYSKKEDQIYLVNKKLLSKDISKIVPRESYKLIHELEQQDEEYEESIVEDYDIRSREAKRVVLFNDNLPNGDTYINTKNTANPDHDQADEIALIDYLQESDFDRDIIKDSMRPQIRKTVVLKLFQGNVHSPLFFDRIGKPFFFSFDLLNLMQFFFKKCIRKKTEFKISDYTKENTRENEKKEENIREKWESRKRKEKVRIEIAESWDSILFAQVLRSSFLITQSIIRKYIVIPSLIITKNLIRMLLFEFPEWSEDFKDWNKERHVKCTYNGVPVSEKEFPKNWLTEGIQIKILFPFRLKPWHRSKLQSTNKNSTKKKEQQQQKKFCFLTVLGMEVKLPFNSPRKRFFFFEPIFQELKKKMKKWKKKRFKILTFLKERTNFLFLKELLKQFSKIMNLNKKRINRQIPIYQSNEAKKEKNWRIRNQIIDELSIPLRSIDWTKDSLREQKIKDLIDITNTLINKTDTIIKEKKKEFRTSKKNISPNKISSDHKRLQSAHIKWKILKKKKNVELIQKFHHFIKVLNEKIYIYIFLGMINIPRINAQFLIESIKKYISNNEENEEIIDKTNQNITHFIETIKKSVFYINNKNTNLFFDLSYLSQAYVFYKLSQTEVINLSKLRSIFQYHGTSIFLKNEIKDYFVEVQRIFHSEFKQKNFTNTGMNQWKNWLQGYYEYDLYPIKRSRLIPKKWRNRVNQGRMFKNTSLTKCESYEKNRLIQYHKKNNFETYYALPNQKEYIYNLLSYKSINYEDKKDSYIYGLPVQVNNKKKMYYIYNNDQKKVFDILECIPINNCRVEDNIININKNSDRKFFDCGILHFCIKKKASISAWINIEVGTNSNKNKKSGVYNYKIIEKMDKNAFFDWMGMNDKIVSCSISNFELWFFPEIVKLYNAYRINPWIIPIKFIFSNWNVNDTCSKKKNMIGKKKKYIFISSNEQTLEFEKKNNQVEKESVAQEDLESTMSNQEKYVQEEYAESDLKKRRNKKHYKKNTEVEFDFFLKRYLCFQLKWNNSVNQRMINNINVYCLLLRLINPREIAISSLQRGEIRLDILIIQKDLTLTKLMKKGILTIEPVRLSVKNDGQFIMYQTIVLSLVHKKKFQRYQEKGYGDKNSFDEPIAIHQKSTENRYTKNDDFLVPENILSSKICREFKILSCFNSKNEKNIHRNKTFYNPNRVKNRVHVLDKSKHLDRYNNKLIKLKLFLWPNYRLEDLACMNRYWFDTNNGSRFSMVRIYMYLQLQIR